MTLRLLTRLALVAALTVPLTGASALEYVCAMDGEVHRSCCCEDEDAAATGGARLEKRGCCEVRLASMEPTGKSERVRASEAAPALTPTSAVVAVVSPDPPRVPAASSAPVATGPPTFLRNCSILR